MALSAGTRLGPYEILSPLGAGGMGEVYKARDIRLDRWVALKILPAEVASDPERLHRFEQEARAASALNHPNILSVYDVGSADSVSYIVTELVEGKTLRDLLLRGPLPLKKLLDLGVQIADGLASAHEAGIVHRDLKPANIMVSKDGFAKILDFGLAKVRTAGRGLESEVDTDASTETANETGPGAIVGTVSYMSPEQASGRHIDFHSDQFSFGALFYEMATARRAFQSRTNVDTLAAILHAEPEPVGEVRPETPVPLRWLVERCLAKQPEDRFASTRDLAGDLRQLRDRLSEVVPLGPVLKKAPMRFLVIRRLALILLATLVGFLIFVALGSRSKPIARPVRFTILPPEGGSFNFDSSSPAPVAVSADGRRVVYGGRDRRGAAQLWLRSLDNVEAKALTGTDGATYPFWSPDGRFVAFFSEGKLKKIPSAGGPVQVLTDARQGRGGAWSKDGVILFAPDSTGPLYCIHASGGLAEAVTRVRKADRGETHRWPAFFPDGRHFLYTVNDQGKALSEGGIYVGDLKSRDSRRLLTVTSNALYSPPGYVLFSRDGALFALPFDADRVRPRGEPVAIAERVDHHPYRWNSIFSVSQTGTLAFAAGSDLTRSQLVWLDRSGKRVGVVGEPADYGGLRLSPSSDRCAVEVCDPRSDRIDIWVLELPRSGKARLTSGAPISDCPNWSPDGGRIAFTSHRGKGWDIYERNILTTASEQLLLASEETKTPTDWSPDGRHLALTVSTIGKSQSELWLYSFADRKIRPYLRTSYSVREGRFSPDGKWVAYVAEETGRPEVYVSPFPSADRKWQVSTTGGSQPIWSRTSELFFVAPDRKLFVARLSMDPPFRVEALEPLFEIAEKPSASDIPLYDVSRDGSRFLVNIPTQERTSQPLTVVLGWAEGVGR